MASLFTRIVKGEIPCHKIAETADFLAFLDINPLAKGHTLCIPKKEVDYIFDIDDKEYADLLLFSKRVASAIEAVIECKRIGMSVVGLEVPHAHVHLIPINRIHDLSFTNPRVELSGDEMAATAKEIAAKYVAE